MSLTPLVRGLVRSPALTIAATLCTAIGVAATTAVATLANSVLLRPVPFPDADRLVRVWLEEPGVDPRVSLSIPESRDLQQLPVFEQAFATARVRVVGVHNDGAERLRGEGVDHGYFERLGLRPEIGRLLQAEDHRPAAPPVIVIGHGLWTRGYGGRSSVIGATLRTQRGAYTIVGVTPRSFLGTVEDDQVEFWMPIEHYEPKTMIADRNVRQTWFLGALRPGATAADLDRLLAATTEEWKARDADRYRRLRLRAEPFGDSWRAGLRRGTTMLGGAAVLLLLIAALNVGCLLLARVLDRSREFALRQALGAGRARLVRQLMAEALVMSAGGGLLGVVLGPPALTALLSVAPIALPSYLAVVPDGRVAVIAVIVLLVAGLIAGTAPAFVGSSLRGADALQAGSRGVVGKARERRWIPILISAEVAMTLVILFAGGLLVRSLDRLSSFDLGYARDGIARLAVTFSRDDAGPVEARAATYDRLATAVLEAPGVSGVGLIAPTLPPYDPSRARVRFARLDVGLAPDGLPAGLHRIDHRLLPVLGVPVVTGRNFHPGERSDTVIVSRGLASRMGGEEAALGQRLRVAPIDHGDPEGEFLVVGVAADVAFDGFTEQDTRRTIDYTSDADPRAGRWDIYLPLDRFPALTVSVAVATTGSASSIIEPARRSIARMAPTSAIHWVGTMADDVALEYAPARFYGALVGAFSLSALLLTCVGLFALLWHTAATRTGEMGLRLALGAQPSGVAWLVVASATRPLMIGAVIGMLGALWVGEWLRGFLYGVPPLDPVSLAGATTVMVLGCLAASLLPAHRAASVDPLIALKSE
jgi:putative ABC transport system permease protein